MAKVETEKRLDLGKHELGYEWIAGNTPPGDSAPGQWLVRKYPRHWGVIFHSIIGAEYPIHKFGPTPDGERAAKAMALRLVDVAWGRCPPV